MKRWVLILGITLGVGIAATVGYLFMSPVAPSDSTYVQEGVVLTAESLALIPKGFPRPLILGSQITVESGSLVALASPTLQYRVTVRSDMSPAQLTGLYRTYFSNTWWNITADTSTDTSATLTANQQNQQFSVTTSWAFSGSQAILEYRGPAWPDFSK